MHHLPGCVQLRPVDSPEQAYTLRIRGMCTSSYREGQQQGVWLLPGSTAGKLSCLQREKEPGTGRFAPQLSLPVEMLCAECYEWFTRRVYTGHNPKQSWKAQLFAGNKSTGNPWFSAHEKVLFFKHTDVFKWKITLLTFSECDHVLGADINHCRAVCCRQSSARGVQAQGGTCLGSHLWGVPPVPPSTQGAGSWGELWQYLGFAPTVLETKQHIFFPCMQAEKFVA